MEERSLTIPKSVMANIHHRRLLIQSRETIADALSEWRLEKYKQEQRIHLEDVLGFLNTICPHLLTISNKAIKMIRIDQVIVPDIEHDITYTISIETEDGFKGSFTTHYTLEVTNG